MFSLNYTKPAVFEVFDPLIESSGVRLFVRREDQNHPDIKGNKWWKLKYNIAAARESGFGQLLTFGGAWSNHLYATAAAAREMKLKSIGIVRGEQTLPLNPILSFAASQQMKLDYISRTEYKDKINPSFVSALKEKYGDFFLIPEGGTNELAIRGCAELGQEIGDSKFDFICLPAATGGTAAGIIKGLDGKGTVIAFSVLNDKGFLKKEIASMLSNSPAESLDNWEVDSSYHFGGYAKTSETLEVFIKQIGHTHGIPLEFVYSGKMMFGIYDRIKKGTFARGSVILALHTGGVYP